MTSIVYRPFLQINPSGKNLAILAAQTLTLELDPSGQFLTPSWVNETLVITNDKTEALAALATANIIDDEVIDEIYRRIDSLPKGPVTTDVVEDIRLFNAISVPMVLERLQSDGLIREKSTSQNLS